MTEFMFGFRTGLRLSDSERQRRMAAAKKHRCRWVEQWEQAGGFPEVWRSWFAKRNEGAPFDAQVADRVMSELQEVSDDRLD